MILDLRAAFLPPGGAGKGGTKKLPLPTVSIQFTFTSIQQTTTSPTSPTTPHNQPFQEETPTNCWQKVIIVAIVSHFSRYPR